MNKIKFISTITILTISILMFVNVNYGKTCGDDNTVISVPSIVCGSCVKKVTKALQKVDGVSDVKVDLDTKTATVKFDNTKTTISDLENAITAAGYDANDKAADAVAYDKLDKCCKSK